MKTVKELAEEVDGLPQEIKKLSLEILDEEEKFFLKKKSQELRVNDEKFLIQNEMIDGRKKFSNQELRDAELSRRLSESDIYKSFDEELRKMEKNINTKKIEQRFLYDRLKTIGIQADILHEASKTSKN